MPKTEKPLHCTICNTYELLFCEKCGGHKTGLNGTKCECGNWLYYDQMVKKKAVIQ